MFAAPRVPANDEHLTEEPMSTTTTTVETLHQRHGVARRCPDHGSFVVSKGWRPAMYVNAVAITDTLDSRRLEDRSP